MRIGSQSRRSGRLVQLIGVTYILALAIFVLLSIMTRPSDEVAQSDIMSQVACPGSTTPYLLQPQESLADVLSRYRFTVKQFLVVNPSMKKRAVLRAGEQICLPWSSNLPPSSKDPSPMPSNRSEEWLSYTSSLLIVVGGVLVFAIAIVSSAALSWLQRRRHRRRAHVLVELDAIPSPPAPADHSPSPTAPAADSNSAPAADEFVPEVDELESGTGVRESAPSALLVEEPTRLPEPKVQSSTAAALTEQFEHYSESSDEWEPQHRVTLLAAMPPEEAVPTIAVAYTALAPEGYVLIGQSLLMPARLLDSDLTLLPRGSAVAIDRPRVDPAFNV